MTRRPPELSLTAALASALATALSLAACMPAQEPGPAGPAQGTSGGRTGTGGANSGSATGGTGSGGNPAPATGGAGPTDAGGETGGPPAATGSCLELRVRSPGADAQVRLAVTATLAGKPLVFGERNPLASGGSLTPTNFRFYLSSPQLVKPGGGRLPADLVGSDGRPLPYNVQLISFDENPVVRLAAPAGRYEGLVFVFGVADACNAIDPGRQKSPLNHASQMTWPHAAGYLFLRYEAQLINPASPTPPTAIHMGGKIGQIFAPEVSLSGPLSASTEEPSLTSTELRVSLDEILAGAIMDAVVAPDFGPPSPEAIAGERLRQNLAKVKVFSLSAP